MLQLYGDNYNNDNNDKTTVPYSQLMLCAKWTYSVHNDRT